MNEKTHKKSWFKELILEFKNINWPYKMTLAKQTAAVISVSVALGALIAVIDFVLQHGVEILVNLG